MNKWDEEEQDDVTDFSEEEETTATHKMRPKRNCNKSKYLNDYVMPKAKKRGRKRN